MGEADCLLTLYTLHRGKVRAIAKGMRRPGGKLGGHLEPLTHSKILLLQERDLCIVTQSQTVKGFLPSDNELWRISCALYLIEMVDRFTGEEEEDYLLFKLLEEALSSLCNSQRTDTILRYFELHLMGHLGYRPQLQQCLKCNSILKPTTNFFSAGGGGVLCPSCSYSERSDYPISCEALKVLRFLQSSNQATATRLRTTPEVAMEVEGILHSYIRYFLEQEVKSAKWLRRLRNETAPRT